MTQLRSALEKYLEAYCSVLALDDPGDRRLLAARLEMFIAGHVQSEKDTACNDCVYKYPYE